MYPPLLTCVNDGFLPVVLLITFIVPVNLVMFTDHHNYLYIYDISYINITEYTLRHY